MFFNKNSRFNIVLLLFIVFLSVSVLVRFVFFMVEVGNLDLGILSVIKIFAVGMFYDSVAFLYYIPFVVLFLILIPNRVFDSKIGRFFTYTFLTTQFFAFLFNGVSEWFFWQEFGKRFNFIAVDYLVYTQEVIHNILESYPVGSIVIAIFILSCIMLYLLYTKTTLLKNSFNSQESFKVRLGRGAVFFALPFLFFNILDKQELSKISNNMYNNELAKNGFYSLFSAFRNNTLDYDEFYKTNDIETVMNSLYKSEGFNDKLYKKTIDNRKDLKYNVVLIMVESLSAKYMGVFGDNHKLTPHLDNLAKRSLFFDNLYATGTRTVRGMEAVTLSLPPTPGRSIVKRPDNYNMDSVGFIFDKHGYDSKFIYAGHGYFDNMNSFFSHNGFKIVDRTDFSDDEVTFSNVWGACDEDLFNKVLKEADNSYRQKKPFFDFIMTTSNHRPYTYPDGKIDIPSHSGRGGGVRYTDFAIDEFLKQAQKKDWFDNTIFVIVADHNGGSAGKSSLPIHRYKIPLIIYAPKIIKPNTIHKISSQVDIMPTLFSMLHWSYESKFYGRDILSQDFKPRAFIGNYQKLGLLEGENLLILEPNRSSSEYNIVEHKLYSSKYKKVSVDKNLENRAIMYYQSANYMYKNKELGVK